MVRAPRKKEIPFHFIGCQPPMVVLGLGGCLTYRSQATRVTLSMLPDSIHAKTRDDIHAGVRSSPDERPECMLRMGVPSARDEDECRGDGAFESALDSSQDHQMSKVLCKSNAENNNAPENHDDRQKLAGVALLHQPVAGKLADHIRKIKDRHQPVELLSDKARILSNAEYSLNAQGSLVGLLGSVAWQ